MSEGYADVLAVAQEKLTEGDYLKIANFLKTLHDESSPKIILDKRYSVALDSSLRFTFSHFGCDKAPESVCITLHEAKVHHIVYAGTTPNIVEITLSGSFDKKKFVDMPYSDFVRKILAITECFGITKIQRTIMGYKHEYDDLGSVRLMMKNINSEKTRLDDDDQDDPELYSESYILCWLFGLDRDVLKEHPHRIYF